MIKLKVFLYACNHIKPLFSLTIASHTRVTMPTARPFSIHSFDGKPKAAIHIKCFTYYTLKSLHATVQSICICKKMCSRVNYRFQFPRQGARLSGDMMRGKSKKTRNASVIYQIGKAYVNIPWSNMRIGVNSVLTKYEM